MIIKNHIEKNRYFDSLLLMKISAEIGKAEGVVRASAGMGTPMNMSILDEMEILNADGKAAGPNDLIIAVAATDEKAAANATVVMLNFLSGAQLPEAWDRNTISHDANGHGTSESLSGKMMQIGRLTGSGCYGYQGYRSIDRLCRTEKGFNLAVISTAGEFAGALAREAIENGLNVFIFSDGVSADDEAALKIRAEAEGLLVMGPSCGLSFINGTAIGLCSKTRRGAIGIVAASGSGMQEVMCIIHRRGGGISHAIGTGGGDLSGAVGGISTIRGIKLLEDDPGTKVIVLVSKPPADIAEKKVLAAVKNCRKPVIVMFINGDDEAVLRAGAMPAYTFEDAAIKALDAEADVKYRCQKTSYKSICHDLKIRAANTIKNYNMIIQSGKNTKNTKNTKKHFGKYIRGIFCGGTLAEEAIQLISCIIGTQHKDNAGETVENLNSGNGDNNTCISARYIMTNVKIRGQGIQYVDELDKKKSTGHTIIDIGGEEFTKGRPHAAIDPSVRVARFCKEAADPETGVILMDFLLGYGMHEDPAGIMADPVREVLEKAEMEGRKLYVVASICGTDLDPQDYNVQKRKLEEAGIVVTENNAEAAVMAAVLVSMQDYCYVESLETASLILPVISSESQADKETAVKQGGALESLFHKSIKAVNIGARLFADAINSQKTVTDNAAGSKAGEGAGKVTGGSAGKVTLEGTAEGMGESAGEATGEDTGDSAEGRTVKAEAFSIDWRPPVYCDSNNPKLPDTLIALREMAKPGVLADKIRAANRMVIDIMQGSDPYWIGMKPAIECVPGMEENLILHSGPSISWEEMCETQQTGIMNGILYEKYATGYDEAYTLIKRGEIKYAPANDYHIVAPGSGIATSSMTVNIVEDRKTGARGFCAPFEGPNRGGLAGWGIFNENIRIHLDMVKDVIAPVVTSVLSAAGGMALKSILTRSVEMGDELHSRQDAAGLLAVNEMMRLLVKSETSLKIIRQCADLFYGTTRFFHPIDMAAAMCVHEAVREVPYSTVVTAMEGNGVEFGIKLSGTGNKWYTAPSPILKGNFVSTDVDSADVLPWIGDSCMLEAAGLGGFAAAAAPAVMRAQGRTISDGMEQSLLMEDITLASHNAYLMPQLDYRGTPLGIDLRKVLTYGIEPVIHGGIISKSGKRLGSGIARVPMKCFTEAAAGYAEKYIKK